MGLLASYLLVERKYEQPSSKEIGFRLAIVAVGLVMELAFRYFALTNYPSVEYFVPSWLFLVWLSFGLTFHGCYGWLKRYSIWLSVALGGVFGPLTYWIASHIAPFEIKQPVLFTIASSLFWALLYGISVRFSEIKKSNLYIANDAHSPS